MNNKNIFSEFNKVSAKAWKQKIQMDLKGADYNKTLVTLSLENINIQPFYHKEAFKSLEIPEVKQDSIICQTLFINDEHKVNNITKEALTKGAESIRYIANKPFDFDILFKNLPKDISYLIVCDFFDEMFFKQLSNYSKPFNIRIILDVIHHFNKEGNWFVQEKIDFDKLLLINSFKSITIGVNASLYQNSGANIIQQIAYSLAHVNEYLNLLSSKTNFIFTFAIGSVYFFEISKIRAFKHLINKLFSQYDSNIKYQIILEPTLRNKTLYDYNVNLLRTTTESMASMLCGADFISNTPYDYIYHKANEFGSRIARNQLLILKEESYFNKNKNITKGTYYIEQLTFDIANKSLLLFKDIEKNGGFLAQLKKGVIQRKIEESANKEQNLFDKGELVLLGTNKYPNSNDIMKNNLELYPFIKTNPRKTIITPIIAKRLAEKTEKERLKTE